jgi:dephospho-CoA kinase
VLRIGLTGGIGAGKSTVAERLRSHGAVVVDADRLAREVLAPGSPGLAAVVEEFGPRVLTADGGLDRAALAAVAFADEGRRRALEAITHPRIAARTAELFAAAAPDAVVVHDVPLLVEKAMGPAYHLVLVVDAPEPVRVARLAATRRMAEADALARIRAQAGAAQRHAAADVELNSDRPRAEVAADVDRLWQDRLLPYEHNVRTGTAVLPPDPAPLVPYDERWPARAARLAGRVSAAVGSAGCAVEHVGPTAVPGLPAEDVVDLQLAVPSAEVADELAPALAAAGFPRRPSTSGPSGASGRSGTSVTSATCVAEHAGADPAALVRLHVRLHASPEARTALLLRDWLAANPGEREGYAGERVRLAERSAAREERAAGEQRWLEAALPRAQSWADRTGWAPPG